MEPCAGPPGAAKGLFSGTEELSAGPSALVWVADLGLPFICYLAQVCAFAGGLKQGGGYYPHKQATDRIWPTRSFSSAQTWREK